MERSEAIRRIAKLKGCDLHALAKKYEVTVTNGDGKVNKGWAGHVIERYLGLALNSSRSPNFGSWELKVVPIRYLKNGSLAFKETMAVTMIDPYEVACKPFKDSHLFAKLRKLLIVARTVGDHYTDPSLVYSTTSVELSGETYTQVKMDYQAVRDCVKDPNRGFDVLTGKMGTLIQPRTKGKANSTSRAFYARKKFLEHFIDLRTPPDAQPPDVQPNTQPPAVYPSANRGGRRRTSAADRRTQLA